MADKKIVGIFKSAKKCQKLLMFGGSPLRPGSAWKVFLWRQD